MTLSGALLLAQLSTQGCVFFVHEYKQADVTEKPTIVVTHLYTTSATATQKMQELIEIEDRFGILNITCPETKGIFI